MTKQKLKGYKNKKPHMFNVKVLNCQDTKILMLLHFENLTC